jgi:hypothetical protein
MVAASGRYEPSCAQQVVKKHLESCEPRCERDKAPGYVITKWEKVCKFNCKTEALKAMRKSCEVKS